MKIGLIGDLHGDFAELKGNIDKGKIMGCKAFVQVGDFGFWPQVNPVDPKLVSDIDFYWIDGNHEYFPNIPMNNLEPTELWKGCWWIPRGTILPFGDMNVLFMGGGLSIDRKIRVPGRDWFPEEGIKQHEIDRAISHNVKIDVVLSHSAPNYFLDGLDLSYTIVDHNAYALDKILETYHPRLWCFGHYHQSAKGEVEVDGKLTQWHCLDINELLVIE